VSFFVVPVEGFVADEEVDESDFVDSLLPSDFLSPVFPVDPLDPLSLGDFFA
jgi:hypothetical protein